MNIRNNFKKGCVEMLVLHLLSSGDLYGYQITQAIERKTNGLILVPEGSLYPTLYRLVENGCITDRRVQVGKRMTRVYYHIEPKGLQQLDAMVKEFHLFFGCVRDFISAPVVVGKEDPYAARGEAVSERGGNDADLSPAAETALSR